MLSKCANPSCSERFKYLRDGKLFHIELQADDQPVPLPTAGKPYHHMEHFWLCGQCARQMTLAYSKARGIYTVALAEVQPQAAA